jgi:hypothetical protein
MSEETSPSGRVPNEKKPNIYSPSGALAVSSAHFYQVRSRIYAALLVFIVVVGLPIVGIPGLRQRLGGRTLALRQALYGPVPKLTTLKVGENKEPLPEEYKTPSAVEIPVAKPAPIQLALPASIQSTPRISKQVIRAGAEQAAEEKPAETGSSVSSVEAEQQQAESGPKFQQGSVEKEAYDLLLAQNVSVGDMLSGKNPGLQFKSWSAAKQQDEGTYLVDLAFTRLPENQEEHFIWQVNLVTKKITPMSFNARSLPK